MKHRLITLAVAAAVAAPLGAQAAAKPEAKFFGYTQITAAAGKGQYDNKDADGLRFGADSIRLGYKIKYDQVWGFLQVDFNKTDKEDNIGIPEILKDAVVGYKFSKAAKVRAGLFKTPVGMDFSNPSKKLDITKRGMDTGLVLERAAGLMVSGRKIGGGFGYDVGVFNPAARSAAVTGGFAGDDMAYAGRLLFEQKNLHLEAYYGTSTGAGNMPESVIVDMTKNPLEPKNVPAVTNSEDYAVLGAGGIYKTGPLTLKAEYISGSDVKGKKGYDESVWYVHGGYAFDKHNELVLRHYAASSDAKGKETDLGNTYVGWNLYLTEHKIKTRIQLNYVFVSGDNKQFNGAAAKKYAYTDDVLLAQFQVGF